MIVKRISMAMNDDDLSILNILIEASSDGDATSALRRSLRIAYAQHLANESGDLMAIVSNELAPEVIRVLDGVGLMSKTSIENKFKCIR